MADASRGRGDGDVNGSSSQSEARTHVMGDFTAGEYERLSREAAEQRLDARDKTHYRAFDEVGERRGAGVGCGER